MLPMHILDELTPIDTVGVTDGLTVIVIALELAFGAEAQAFEVVKTQLITSPFDKVLFEYTAVFVPTLLPFSFH